jgi:hypothetical protein
MKMYLRMVILIHTLLMLALQHYMEVSGDFTLQGQCPQYPLDRRLGGPQSKSRRDNEEKNPALSGIEP